VNDTRPHKAQPEFYEAWCHSLLPPGLKMLPRVMHAIRKCTYKEFLQLSVLECLYINTLTSYFVHKLEAW